MKIWLRILIFGAIGYFLMWFLSSFIHNLIVRWLIFLAVILVLAIIPENRKNRKEVPKNGKKTNSMEQTCNGNKKETSRNEI